MNCFENVVKYKTPGWTYAYCVTSTIELLGYLVLFLLSTFILTILIVYHRKQHGGRCICSSFWKKDRAKIIAIGVVMTAVLTVREGFMIGDYAWTCLLIA